MRVFLVEDEALILMMTAELVASLGHEVVAEAGSIETAIEKAQSVPFDVAVLDVNVAGVRIDPVAEILDKRGLPFVFVTGYSIKALPETFANRPHLQKPILACSLESALDAAIDFAGSKSRKA